MRTWIALATFPALLFAQTASKPAKQAFDGAALAAKAGKTQEAMRGYKKAIEADPAYAEAWCALGRLQAKAQMYKEARNSFEQAIRADPDYLEPYAPLALLLNAAKDWQALADTTDRQLKIEPYGPAIGWLLNATARYNLKQLDLAEKSAREAQRLDAAGKHPRIPYLIGNIRIARGDTAGASAALGRFLEIAPADPEAASVKQTIARLEKEAETKSTASTGATFQVTTELALVSFMVEPRKGELVTDLRPVDIEVREDGAPQKIAFFEGGKFYPRKVPVEVTLLFDASRSVRFADALDVSVFEKSLLSEYENVSLAIYGFSDELTRFTAPTRDLRKLRQAMAAVTGINPRGTPLFGQIAETLKQAASTQRSAVRMLVVFSDGLSEGAGDDTRVAEAIQQARNRGVAVYPVALTRTEPTGNPARGARGARGATPDPRYATAAVRSVADFMSLASATGGQGFTEFSNGEALQRILAAIATRVKYNYVVGYYPTTENSGARGKIEVRWAGKARGEIIGGSRVMAN